MDNLFVETEEFTRTDEGAVYAIADYLQHENPLRLIPHSLVTQLFEHTTMVGYGESRSQDHLPTAIGSEMFWRSCGVSIPITSE